MHTSLRRWMKPSPRRASSPPRQNSAAMKAPPCREISALAAWLEKPNTPIASTTMKKA